MPDVCADLEVRAPVASVWRTVLDVEKYPRLMASVRSVQIIAVESPIKRRIAWSVSLKGSILTWEEIELIDHEAQVIEFRQTTGDMKHLEGEWRLQSAGEGVTRVQLKVAFEIGIPLLAEMLDPVAERSFHENCADMLQGIERETRAAEVS